MHYKLIGSVLLSLQERFHYVLTWNTSKLRYRGTKMERFRITQTTNVNFYHEPSFTASLVVYCSLCLHRNQYTHASFAHNNCFRQFLSANFLIEKFRTWIWRLPLVVKRDSYSVQYQSWGKKEHRNICNQYPTTRSEQLPCGTDQYIFRLILPRILIIK